MLEFKATKICDPLYAYIYLDPGEKTLIDHLIFQRLRTIQQLGFSEEAFPSGTGKRFSHSLGVFHLAGRAFDSIFGKNKKLSIKESKKQKFKRSVKVAALLHDIGHGPLSHSSETLMPSVKELDLKGFLNTDFNRRACHEDYSIKFIMEKTKEGFYNTIKQAGLEPEVIAQLLHKGFLGNDDFFIEGGLNFLPLLRQIISSDFDVDRMDYLHRDSLYCGVKYGLIDFNWLISHFDCHTESNNQVFLAIDSAGLYTLESFILGRQHMRSIVYFHHKPSIYNQMLKEYSMDIDWRLPSNLSEYIYFTDSKLFDKLRSDSHSNKWARRIVQRKPYLRLYEHLFFTESSYEKNQKEIEFLKVHLEKAKINFIEMNSKTDSADKKKRPLEYTIYLKNRALNQTQSLYKDASFLSLPEREIRRIYVEPERLTQAKEILKETSI